MDNFGPAPLFPYGVWCVFTMVVGLIPVMFIKGKYLRLEKDTEGHIDDREALLS